jgi:hypothetical protein
MSIDSHIKQITTDSASKEVLSISSPTATVAIVVNGPGQNPEERYKDLVDYLHTPPMERALRLLLGSEGGRVVIDLKASAQIPAADIKPNQPIKISMPVRNDRQLYNALGQLLLREAFIKGIIDEAIVSVRQGSPSQKGKDMLAGLACDYVGPRSEEESRLVVRDLAARFLGAATPDRPDAKKLAANANKRRENLAKTDNPMRRRLLLRINELVKELDNDLTQQSVAHLAKVVPEYMRKCAEIKVLDELLHPYPKYATQVTRGVLRLCAAIRGLYATALFTGKVEDLGAALNLLRDVHSELSNGGFSRPLPRLFKGAQSAVNPNVATLTRAAKVKGTGLTQLTNGGIDSLEKIDAKEIASDINELSEIIELDQRTRQQISKTESLLEELIGFHVEFSPSLPRILTAVDKREQGADLKLLADLLVNTVVMKISDNPVGLKSFLQIFTSTSDSQDRSNSNDESERHALYFRSLQLIRKIEQSNPDTHASILADHRDFISGFQLGAVAFCSDLYLKQLKSNCANKQDISEEDWELAIKDISKIEASIDSVLNHLPSNFNKMGTENLLRSNIKDIHNKMAELLEICLKAPLEVAQKMLDQSIEDSLAEGVIVPLVACSKMLLNRESLSASWGSAFQLAVKEKIKDAISSYINLLEDGYVDNIRRNLTRIKTAVSEPLDLQSRTAVDYAQAALYTAGLLFRELKVIETAFRESHEIKGVFNYEHAEGGAPELINSLSEYAAALRARTERELKAVFDGRTKLLDELKLSLQGKRDEDTVIIFEAIAALRPMRSN